jgi:dipeptidyl aminopeptidase/acylaminoacyl peptidase
MWRARAMSFSVPLLAGALLACAGGPSGQSPLPGVLNLAADPVATPRAEPSLIPRRLFFDYPDRAQVKISPDGQRIGWLAPVRGVLDVWVGPADDVKKAQPVTQIVGGDIRSWGWTFGSDRALFVLGKGGDDSRHLYAVDLVKKETTDLTPIDGVRAELVGLSPKHPAQALVSLNDRDRKAPDVYLVDLPTGARKLVQQNDGGYGHWFADDELRVRYATRQNADASADLLQPPHGKEKDKDNKDKDNKDKDKWKPFQQVPMEDALTVQGVEFDKSGNTFYLKDSRNRDTSALFAVDTTTGKATLVAEDPHSDVGQVLLHPTNKTVEAVSFDYERPTWVVIDAAVEGDFYYLQTFGDGTLLVTSRSLDEQRWVVAYAHSDGPTRYYRYDRNPDIPGNVGKATFLFSSKDELEHAKLAATERVLIKARDGLDLVSYLTLPYDQDPRGEGRPKEPLPTVLLVHGGPWARATREDSPEHPWLASRGYAVLSVNYRGSTGFGKQFVNAGNLEWGGKMRDDLVDAAKWAVDQKVADPTKVAIMGAGYGGYATLVGMTMSPHTFACGVDVGGPSNLLTLVQTVSPYWQPQIEELAKRLGDWRTDDGKKLLTDRSPVTYIGAINKPLLIGQGKNDPYVSEAQSVELAAAIRSKRVPVTWVVDPDEGQGFARPPNRTGFSALAELFLAQCLGGPYQPIGDDLAASTIRVSAGAQYMYGLREAMVAKK